MRKGYQYMSHADITPSIQKQPDAKEKEEEWKKDKGIIKCINHSMAIKWANILLQYRINAIWNIITKLHLGKKTAWCPHNV
jgi:hypothetical protein